jgi:DNA mismatch endonuclease, patch repair protein
MTVLRTYAPSHAVEAEESRMKTISSKPLSRSEIMRRVKGRDSQAEQSVRSVLHNRGLRFLKNSRVEGILADIVFPGAKIIVLVDGCFWHCCPKHATFPKTNRGYWIPKLKENRERDLRQSKKLRAAGWILYRIWEHDCFPPPKRILDAIEDAYRAARNTRPKK